MYKVACDSCSCAMAKNVLLAPLFYPVNHFLWKMRFPVAHSKIKWKNAICTRQKPTTNSTKRRLYSWFHLKYHETDDGIIKKKHTHTHSISTKFNGLHILCSSIKLNNPFQSISHLLISHIRVKESKQSTENAEKIFFFLNP